MAQNNSIVSSLETPAEGQGVVTIDQDARLTEWLKKGSVTPRRWSPSTSNSGSAQTSLPKNNLADKAPSSHSTDSTSSHRQVVSSESVKKSGYRVQIYSGPATREAKNQAAAAAAKARTFFPDVSAYPIFVSPRWVCVIGDFLTREEAVTMKQRISNSGVFNESTIVRSQVLIIR